MMSELESPNLCLRADAGASCSVMNSIGDGVQDPNYILKSEQPWEDGLWCDTYDGLNLADSDWWAVHWSRPLECNVIQFHQGPLTDSGGWWLSLRVEYQAEAGGTWQKAANLTLTPEYNFEDRRDNRKPYERYTLTFDRVRCVGVRLIGRPGGLAQHTKIAKLAVFNRDLSFWHPEQTRLLPKPRLLRLLPPAEVFQWLVRFYPVCDILFTLVSGRLNLMYFLDENEYAQWKSLSRYSADPTDFWRRVYDREGAWRWYSLTRSLIERAKQEQRAVTGVRPDGLGQVVAPLIVDGQALGVLRNTSLVQVAPFDPQRRLAYIRELELDEARYLREMARVPQVSLHKLEAIGAFLESIANTLKDLSLRNELLGKIWEKEQASQPGGRDQSQLAQQAIAQMRERLEEPQTISGLARRLSISQSHLSRLFRQETGASPKQYLIDLRLERAAFLLRSGKVSVAEACSAVGYQNISSFTRLFRQRFEVAPAEYARRGGG
jgi:AraC-like DNA-binding protein